MYRRQALSTPRRQVYSFTSCSDSERESHRLPKSLAFRQIQCQDHLLFQKNGELEEKIGYCKSIQQGNQCHAQSSDLLTEDLKFPTNSRHSDSARTSCEERHAAADAAENKKMCGTKKRETNCLSSRVISFVCAVLIIALLLAWWKQHSSNELYFVPT